MAKLINGVSPQVLAVTTTSGSTASAKFGCSRVLIQAEGSLFFAVGAAPVADTNGNSTYFLLGGNGIEMDVDPASCISAICESGTTRLFVTPLG